MQNLRFGLIGLGHITKGFIRDLALVEGAEAVAVASRSLEKAKAFAAEHGVKKYYGSYVEILQDPEVDIIYIGTPHDSHEEWSIAAMNAGKHVLCEKPMGVNRAQVERMVEAARTNRVFLMEALWARFNPTIKACLELVRSGAIGEVNYLNADFAFLATKDTGHRLLKAELAGGTILDIGIYPLFLAYSLFGKPKEIMATGLFHPKTGVDIQVSMILKYPSAMASLYCGFVSKSDMVARICGTEGSIYIDGRWHESKGYTLERGGEMEKVSLPTLGKGLTYEIRECIECISQQKMQSELWSHQNSLDLAEILDEVRSRVGVRYGFE